MSTILYGKPIADEILKRAHQRVADLDMTPRLGVVLVGNDKPSQRYVAKKQAAAKAIGAECIRIDLPADSTDEAIIAAINELQHDKQVHGLIVQLPLPAHIDTHAVVNSIDPDRDVDCLTDTHLGRLVTNTSPFIPPSPGAILAILERLHVDLQGARITIVGTGTLVGKPLAIMLMNKGVSVSTANKHTPDLAKRCLDADIIISATGKRDLIRGNMVTPGAIVIDAGVSVIDGKAYGDVCSAEVSQKAAYLTPTPGGVGPITVALLLQNTVQAAGM